MKNFCYFMSLPSFQENVCSCQHLQAFIKFTCKNSPKTFAVVKQSAENVKIFHREHQAIYSSPIKLLYISNKTDHFIIKVGVV